MYELQALHTNLQDVLHMRFEDFASKWDDLATFGYERGCLTTDYGGTFDSVKEALVSTMTYV